MHQESSASEMLQQKPKIIAAIPCFNEERFIGSVVLKAKRYVDSVIVIDDGSTDATAEVAAEAGAEVHRHSQNQGYGVAIRSALAKGRQLGVDVLVVLDGDGQHDPKDIPKLVKSVINGQADVAVGSRFLGKGEKPPLYRRLGQRVLTTATNVGSGQSISDSQSGFRAYSARALEKLDLAESGMSISSEIQFASRKGTLRVTEVPINVSYTGEAKRSPVGHGLRVLSRITVLISLRNPLLLFGVPGVVLLTVGVVLGIRVLTVYSQTQQFAIGNALGTILLSLSGLLALFTALTLRAMKEVVRGEISRLAHETKGHTPGKKVGQSEGDTQ